jgi:hypothetical protein
MNVRRAIGTLPALETLSATVKASPPAVERSPQLRPHCGIRCCTYR